MNLYIKDILKQLFEFEIKTGFFIKLGYTVLAILIILLAAGLMLRVIRMVLALLESRKLFSSAIIIIFRSILRWMVFICAGLLILHQTGISLNNIWAIISAIVAMIAIGFVAVWSILSNLLCTLMLIIFHPFRIGDEIEVIDPAMTAGVNGKVKNINLMFTILQQRDAPDGAPVFIYIPNNLLFQKIIRRKAGERTFSLDRQLFEENTLLRSNNVKHTDKNGNGETVPSGERQQSC